MNAEAGTDALLEPQDDGALLIRQLQAKQGSVCAACHRPLSLQQILGSIALGAGAAPRCLDCLAAALEQSPTEMAESLMRYFRGRSCYWAAWHWAAQIETGGLDSIAARAQVPLETLDKGLGPACDGFSNTDHAASPAEEKS